MLGAEDLGFKLEFGQAKLISNHCPLIYTLVHHVLGNGDQEFERFINWLAYIFQTRKKAKTAWVLGGVPGTGKGLFYSKVLRPLFGSEHVPMRALQSIEEHFNLYMRNSIFLIVDEFHMASSSLGAMKIADKLKNQITEDTITIRAMRTNQVEVPNFTNFIFLTNRNDAVKIENGDRRYNIPPRQEFRLEEAHPELLKNLDKLEDELFTFGSILHSFVVNERMVHTCIDNQAKNHMRHVSMSLMEEFSEAIKRGNLLFFSDILDINTANVQNMNEVATAQRFVKSWIANAKEKYDIIPMEHLRTVYHVQTESSNRLSQREFTKQMSRNGIETSRKRAPNASRDSNLISGVTVTWNIDDLERQRLINIYFDGTDQRLLQNTNISYTDKVNSN
jgi:phage/plasmid-associated DNA primase